MTYGKRGRGLSRFLLCALLAGLVTGCARGGYFGNGWDAGQTSAFVQAQPSEAWVSVPSARLVLTRSGTEWREQKILLANETVLPGDNFVFLRAVAPGLSMQTRLFDMDSVIAAAGGVPEPFTRDDLRFLKSTSDAAGDLVYAASNNGAGVSCVLAFRGLGAGQRALPGRAERLEIMMRNCVEGPEEDALDELAPALLGFGGPPPTGTGNLTTTLSPLARPYQ